MNNIITYDKIKLVIVNKQDPGQHIDIKEEPKPLDLKRYIVQGRIIDTYC